jgi:hypothetical protein
MLTTAGDTRAAKSANDGKAALRIPEMAGELFPCASSAATDLWVSRPTANPPLINAIANTAVVKVALFDFISLLLCRGMIPLCADEFKSQR